MKITNKKTDSAEQVLDAVRENLVKSVIEDFEARKNMRKPFELQWQLNIDFLRGNQNNYITNTDKVVSAGKQFHWQQREVFNHISNVIEARLAKLVSQEINTSVVPISDDEKEIKRAEICEKIIRSAFEKMKMKSLADQGNMWSEMTGTVFYKVAWNNCGGRLVGEVNGKKLYEGDINIVVCSPFEIYPDSLTAGDINELVSIIHAKPYTVESILENWGVEIECGDVEVFDFNRTTKYGASIMKKSAMVIERYKNGRLTIVAGNKLLFDGEYEGFPFIRQTSESLPGCFFGKSVIERVIPVQRAYNNVKNRKTEFLNRLACGVLAVEDGSVDVEALENDGLAPGTVIVYRQGYQAPKFVEDAVFPEELEREEERLLHEFASITGGTDIARSAESGTLSGVALEIMVEQDKLRMHRAVESSQNVYSQIAGHILRLYKKYGGEKRFGRFTDSGKVNLFGWANSDITSDEVIVSEKQIKKTEA